MSVRRSNLVASIAFVAVCAGLGLAQQAPSEKSAAQIKAEQTPEALDASPLCRWAAEEVAKNHPILVGLGNKPIVTQKIGPLQNPPLSDLRSLFEASDAVILAVTGPTAPAVAPSGSSVITYRDIQVLRSWKGGNKPGDILTFATPEGWLKCSTVDVLTIAPAYPGGGGAFLNVLFLRQSKVSEAQTTPGFRLAGGDDLQGQILLPYSTQMTSTPPACTNFVYSYPGKKDAMDQKIQSCNDFIDKSSDPIAFQSRQDPLATRYGKMPISDFLREMQSVAGSANAPQKE
jgi:hypothetical protein